MLVSVIRVQQSKILSSHERSLADHATVSTYLNENLLKNHMIQDLPTRPKYTLAGRLSTHLFLDFAKNVSNKSCFSTNVKILVDGYQKP